MNMNDYQTQAMSTAIYPRNEKTALTYTALGLASEAGEYAGKLKKLYRDATFDRNDAAAELGDCLWYIAAAADALGITLSDLAQSNLDKLADRKSRDKLKGSGDHR